MIDPQAITVAQRALGRQLARLRKAAGLRQADLATLILTSRSGVANVETGHNRGSLDFWTRADRALKAGGDLIRGYQEVMTLIRQRDADDAHAAAAVRSAATGELTRGVVAAGAVEPRPSGRLASILTGTLVIDESRAPSNAGGQVSQVLIAPAGRFFDGLAIDAQVYPAVDDGRIVTAVPAGFVDDQFLRRPRRALVVGVTDDQGGWRPFGLDSRQARRRLMKGGRGSRLLMPPAYALDDLTLGILWAVANLDEALLNDDGLLAHLQSELARYETLPQSAAGRDMAGDLTEVSRMWLGSDFCARHILRHLPDATDIPLFWTREQRGEEASTWLLFAHKYDYLRAVADRFGPAGLSRAFCIPPETVAASPRAERILLLLAAALMESFSIRVEVCTDPEYSSVEGFVLDDRKAIVANWVGADGIWQVGVTTSRPAIRNYADITGYSRTHSVVEGSSPARRLRLLADYLELDWPRLITRTSELSEYGCAGVAEPRSRLLSVSGADRACRYLAKIGTETD